jgi:hypothetical protein
MNSTNLFVKKHDIPWTHLPKMFLPRVSTGLGILGWIATHVHKKIVVMQLHIMPNSVLQLSSPLHEDDTFDMSRTGTGRARAESKYMKKRKSMMHGRVASLACLDGYMSWIRVAACLVHVPAVLTYDCCPLSTSRRAPVAQFAIQERPHVLGACHKRRVDEGIQSILEWQGRG